MINVCSTTISKYERQIIQRRCLSVNKCYSDTDGHLSRPITKLIPSLILYTSLKYDTVWHDMIWRKINTSSKDDKASLVYHMHRIKTKINCKIKLKQKNRKIGELPKTVRVREYHIIWRLFTNLFVYRQDAQLSQRDRAAGCVIVFAKSRRLELRDNNLRTL